MFIQIAIYKKQYKSIDPIRIFRLNDRSIQYTLNKQNIIENDRNMIYFFLILNRLFYLLIDI